MFTEVRNRARSRALNGLVKQDGNRYDRSRYAYTECLITVQHALGIDRFVGQVGSREFLCPVCKEHVIPHQGAGTKERTSNTCGGTRSAGVAIPCVKAQTFTGAGRADPAVSSLAKVPILPVRVG